MMNRLVPVAVIITALFTGVAFSVVSIPATSEFDQSVVASAKSFRTPALDTLLLTFTYLGDTVSLASIAAIILIALLVQQAWQSALVVGLGYSITPLLVSTVKVIVGRTRPLADLYTGVEAFSFPSGHMTNSMVILGVFSMLLSNTWKGISRLAIYVGFGVVIAIIGVSRVFVGAHWPSDVLAGALLAAAILTLIYAGIRGALHNRYSAPIMNVALLLALCIWVAHATLTFKFNSDFYKLGIDSVAYAEYFQFVQVKSETEQ